MINKEFSSNINYSLQYALHGVKLLYKKRKHNLKMIFNSFMKMKTKQLRDYYKNYCE